ncbi:MAG TPA: aspartate--tRNA(Asn) ligase [Chloroflexia bacterium]|nr:aspartate--tRNA(Asn) ligase [Chloroflexia bacterium]
MQRVRTTELAAHVGERVRLSGWLHQARAMGGINFLLLRDGYSIVQAVTEDAAAVAPLAGLLPETVIELEGTVAAEAQARGGFELHDPCLRVVTPVAEALPFPINKPMVKAAPTTFLDHAAVGLRHPAKRAMFRLAAGTMAAFREVLDGDGFTEIQSPKIGATATEGGANVFAVDYFGRPAYLAQSPQFYKQIMVGVFERVYEVGPVFRAEPHDTTRHINEYVSLDAELGFIADHQTVMALLTRVVRHMVTRLEARHGAELGLLGITLPVVPEPIPQVHFRDAQELLLARHGEDCRGEPDLAPQHERRLGEWAREVHGSDFLFVTGYPMVKRPFYTHPDSANPTYSNSFDLLFRGMEMVTGGQRLHRYGDYLAALERAGLSPEPFASYLEPMRYGMPPHGGFAIGLERFLMQLAGLANVREATLFPRDLHRLSP